MEEVLKYNIFIYWENKKGSKRPKYLEDCLKTLKKHNNNVILVTPSNIKKYVPENIINKKIWKLDLIAQRADYFRVLLLNFNGGLWLDFDTICFANFSKLLSKLEEYDLLFHSEQFFASRKGLFNKLIQEIDNKLNTSINNKYLLKQKVKFYLNKILPFKNFDYRIKPFKWTEIGMDLLKNHINNYNIYKIPEDYFAPKIEYKWEKKYSNIIFSETVEINNFIKKNQLILKLYNSGYSKEELKVLNNPKEDILFNKLINYSLS